LETRELRLTVEQCKLLRQGEVLEGQVESSSVGTVPAFTNQLAGTPPWECTVAL